MSTPLLAHEVEISEGLTLADLTTPDACHLALLTLARDINRIDEQLADGPAVGEWAERAESAIRFKKALRQVVNDRIGTLRRAERAASAATREHLLIEVLCDAFPVEFNDALATVKARRPDLWKD
jgi:hypothetical protein